MRPVATLVRYARLLGVQLRASALLAAQYRLDFVLNAVLSLFWTTTALIPLVVLFRSRGSVAGWSYPEALLVVAWFTLLKGVLDGAIQPSLQGVVEHIHKGTLDFLLLKPADAQFLVSTSHFDLWKGADVLAGLAIAGWALRRLGHTPSVGAVLVTLALLAGAVLLLYSLWIVVVALAFLVVKVENLSYLFQSVYDAARWPSSVFRGVAAWVFTFVVPLAVMTTFPALAILDRLAPARAAAALGGAVAFALAARALWTHAIRRYTSAGG